MSFFSRLFSRKQKFSYVSYSPEDLRTNSVVLPPDSVLGLIAGNGYFPLLFSEEAMAAGFQLHAACHQGETSEAINKIVSSSFWMKLGQVGKMIDYFKSSGVTHVALAGGIQRITHFRDLALDARGASLLLRIGSTKDDLVMRGLAAEIMGEGIEVIPCTYFLQEAITPNGLLAGRELTEDDHRDIEIGVSALRAMGAEDIGQLVVVRKGVVVAVEAVEGTSEALLRGMKLGGEGVVAVKCAKITQDMRFDVPTIGIETIESLIKGRARLLAVEAGRSLILQKKLALERAGESGLSVYGIPPIVPEVLNTTTDPC